MEKGLTRTIRILATLVLVVPLIVPAPPLPHILFPYVVGKVLFARVIIEAAFILWLLLILWFPSYRIPRSRLLIIFSIYLFITLCASIFGTSTNRSIWSTYERMQGWIDLTHWFALSMVLVSMFRTFRQWWVVLNINLVVGLALGLLGFAQMNDVNVLGYLFSKNRLDITLGNATFVGAYMLVNAFIATAFLSYSFAKPTDNPELKIKRTSLSRNKRESKSLLSISNVLILRSFWAIVIVVDLIMLIQSGTRGAIVGLLSALLAFALIYICVGKLRFVRISSLAICGSLFLLVAAFFTLKDTGLYRDASKSIILLDRLASIGPEDTSTSGRINSAISGYNAFKEKPFFGWGPENYTVAYDMYLTAKATATSIEEFDQAHNKVIEEAVTKGALGLISYLAIWVFMAWILITKIRGMLPQTQLFVMLIGTALFAYFVQNLFLFDTPATAVQMYFLIGFVIYIETTKSPITIEVKQEHKKDIRAKSKNEGNSSFVGSDIGMPIASIVATGIFLGSIYFTVLGPYMGSKSSVLGLRGGTTGTWSERKQHFLDAINASSGLSNYPRRFMFQSLEEHWHNMSESERIDSINMAIEQGDLGLKMEPMSWRIYMDLVAVHHMAGVTFKDDSHIALGRKYILEASRLAPYRIEPIQLMVRQHVVESNFDEALAVIDNYLEANIEYLEPGYEVHKIFTNLREKVVEIADARK